MENKIKSKIEQEEKLGKLAKDYQKENDYLVERMGELIPGQKRMLIQEIWIDGYNAALSQQGTGMKWTDADMVIIRNKLVSILPVGDVKAWDLIKAVKEYIQWFDNYTESESQQGKQQGEEKPNREDFASNLTYSIALKKWEESNRRFTVKDMFGLLDWLTKNHSTNLQWTNVQLVEKYIESLTQSPQTSQK